MMRLWRRLAFWLRREDDLANELKFHRQMKEEELRSQGVSEEELRAATQRALGNDLVARQRSRDVWLAPWFQDVTQDIRLAIRMLTRDRRLAATAIVTLGLGMAVCNTAFRFVNTAMFRDVPFERPERLLTIRTNDPRGFLAAVSYPEFLQWREHVTAFEGLAADSSQSVNISDDNHGAERLSGSYITHDTFDLLRVAPILGREFVEADDRDGAPPVAVLSYDLWRSRYGGDPAAIGRDLRVSGQVATIVGVMPQGFRYPMVADLWLPVVMTPGLRNMPWSGLGWGTVGRLKDGASVDQARAEIDAIASTTVREHPEVPKDRRLVVLGLKDSQLANDASQLLWAFLGAAVIVLLLASANVTNLMLARGWQRARETAVRVALGASRWRILRQSLIECALIGVGGAVLGGYLSVAGFRLMADAFNVYEAGAFDRPRKPYWFDGGLDASAWLFMGVSFLLGSLAAGLIPAMHLSRTNANQILAGGRDGQAARRSRRWASALMTAQLAIAVMLLSAAGLFARNLLQLYRMDSVIAVDGLVSMRVTLPAQYGSPEQRLQFVRRLDERLLASPLFSDSAIGDVPLQLLPLLSRRVRVEGEAPDPSATPRTAVYVAAGPRFFDVMRLPTSKGRPLIGGDELRGREAVVVNQRFASLYFGETDPVGKRIQLSQPGPPPVPAPAFLTIVGVIPTIPDFDARRPDDAMVIAPLLGDPTPSRAISVIVRSESKAAAAQALRHEIAALDDDLPVYAIQTLEEQLAMMRMGPRMIGSWFQALAFVAIALASVGLYALTAHGVAQRRTEIGVRMALGAQSKQVLTIFVAQTARLVGAGVTLGLIAALSVNRLLASFLGAVSPRDPLTITVVALLLTTVAMIATLIPSRKAVRVNPVDVLRGD